MCAYGGLWWWKVPIRQEKKEKHKKINIEMIEEWRIKNSTIAGG